jgi:hypothetical protein
MGGSIKRLWQRPGKIIKCPVIMTVLKLVLTIQKITFQKVIMVPGILRNLNSKELRKGK